MRRYSVGAGANEPGKLRKQGVQTDVSQQNGNEQEHPDYWGQMVLLQSLGQ